MREFLIKFPIGVASVIVVLLVLYLTLTPDPLPDNDLPLFPGADKIVHGLMMLGVSGCLAYDLMRSPYGKHEIIPPKMKLFCIMLVTIIFGGVIELLQDYMDLGRSLDIADFVADSIGAVAAFIIELLCWLRFRRWLLG